MRTNRIQNLQAVTNRNRSLENPQRLLILDDGPLLIFTQHSDVTSSNGIATAADVHGELLVVPATTILLIANNYTRRTCNDSNT